jgi:tetratricopeptide (TPR) repeat protein
MFCGRSEQPARTEAAPQIPTPSPGAAYDVDSAISDAQAKRKAGKLNEAATILSQLVLFTPDDVRVLGEYGKTLAALGRSDDALAFLDRAIQLNSNDYSLYSAQGIAYDQKAAYKEAQESYTRALSLKPDDPGVLNNAALSHMQSGDLAGARVLLERASPATKEFPRIAENLAMVQRLIAARPQEAPALPGAPPAVVPAPLPALPSGPVRVGEVEPEPVIPQVEVSPRILLPRPVEAVALAAPIAKPEASSGYEALKADSSVRMAALSKKELVEVSPKPKPSRVQTAAAAPAPKPVAAPSSPSNPSAYYVQAGAYATEERAVRLAQTLKPLGARVSPTTVSGKSLYRVRLGPFLDAEQAGTAISEAKTMVESDLRIVTE